LISCLVCFLPLNPLFPNARHFEYSGHESQVARYSALIFGILYGIVHQNTLQAKYDENKVSRGLATGFRRFDWRVVGAGRVCRWMDGYVTWMFEMRREGKNEVFNGLVKCRTARECTADKLRLWIQRYCPSRTA
jgi:hypothetical protein